jgi:hypothetical protein
LATHADGLQQTGFQAKDELFTRELVEMICTLASLRLCGEKSFNLVERFPQFLRARRSRDVVADHAPKSVRLYRRHFPQYILNERPADADHIAHFRKMVRPLIPSISSASTRWLKARQ